MKILIAEDDPVSRQILEKTLVNWGHEVVVTSDGKAAWAALSLPDAPLLAILDIMMPEIDGLDVCRLVRQLPATIPPYLIMLTAVGGKDDVVAGIQAGANDYVTKPFHREELRVRVGVGERMLELQISLAQRVDDLEAALTQVKQLQGLLPICSYCHKIRDEENHWQKVDTYISTKTDVEFSHGICPACYENVAATFSE